MPNPTVASGTPEGICKMESKASTPFNGPVTTGMPITGKVVWLAMKPGKAAERPAAAIITLMPLPAALRLNSAVSSGLRCAERTFISYGV